MSDERKPERSILAVSFRFLDCELVAKSMDELHLEEICKAVCHGENPLDFNLPVVILLETIRNTSEAEGKYIRQIGGVGNYGHVKIRIESNDRGKGFKFINAIHDGTIPGEYIAPIEEGIREAMQGGILFGYETVDVKVMLTGGSYHDTDSNEMAYRIAASQAFKEAARKASPMLLEPVMKVEARVEEAHAGRVVADITARRGRIESMEPHAGFMKMTAIVPLREMLRSSKYGRPDYEMRFSGYEEARFPRGEFGDYDAGVTANKPNRPTPGKRLAAAPLETELDSF